MSERTYQIRSISDEDVLRIIILGTLGDHKKESANEIAQTVNEIVDKNKPVKVLIDCTGFIGRLGVVDTYDHVREHKRTTHTPSRVAILENAENKDQSSFHETTGSNVGLRNNYFYDSAEALRWLQE